MKNKKVIGIILLILMVSFCLASCSAPAENRWDSRLIEQLHPTEAFIKQARTELQNIDKSANYGGLSFYIGQTLGNREIIYITLDLTVSDTIAIDTLLTNKDMKKNDTNISLDGLHLLKGKISHEDIEALDQIELEQFLRENEYDVNISSVSCSVDTDNKKICFLITATSHSSFIPKQDVSLLIEKVVTKSEKGDATLGEGPFLIAWNMENQGEIYEITISNLNNTQIGTGEISAFGLNLYLYHSSFESYEAFIKSIKIFKKSGEVLSTKGSEGGGYGGLAGECHISWLFSEPLELEEVDRICFEDYKIALNKAAIEG